jgi:hypothetical protein
MALQGSARRAPPAAAFFLFLLLACASLAAAQAQPTVSLAADKTTLALDPGATATVAITVTSATAVPVGAGNVQLTVGTLPSGWTATLNPTSVPAGGQATSTLTVHAPAARPDGTPAGQAPPGFGLGVTGTLADQAGQTATNTVTIQTAFTPAPIPPPAEFPWALALGALAVVVVLAVAGAIWWRREQRESGLRVTAPSDAMTARPGYDAFVPVEVRNTSKRPRIAELRTEEVPQGWAAGTNLTTIPLAAGEAQSVWLAVRPPMDSGAAELALTVRAKPADGKEARAKAVVPIRVVPDAYVPDQVGKDLQVPIFQNTPHAAPGSGPPSAPPPAQEL